MKNYTTEKIIGLVMCGGKSVRMGSDKGMLLLNDKTWAERTYEKLKYLNIPVSVSINETQLETYRRHFPEDTLVVDQVPIPGPLGGLLSAHLQHPGKDLLILACDMTDMEPPIIKNLIDKYNSRNEFDYYVYSYQNQAEPLLGVYKAKALGSLYRMFLDNRLSKFSMKYILETGNTFSLELKEEELVFFRNYNE